jgi:hypothetical protein
MGKAKEAFEKFVHLREQAPRGMIHIQATKYMAMILGAEGEVNQAYEWLMPIRKHLQPRELLLLQQMAFRLKEWNDAVQVGQELYQKEPLGEAAAINAIACAQLGQPKAAAGWLHCASESGYRSMKALIEKKELDPIRESAAFQEFIKSFYH